MRKNSSRFFILSKHRLAAVLAAVVVGIVGAQALARSVQASPGEVQPIVGSRLNLTELLDRTRLSITLNPAISVAMPAASPTPPSAPPEPPELVGEVGYSRAGGNCVNEPGINNPGYGNPSGWPVTSQTPAIGATGVFNYDHVAVVTGIWRNGDVEVRHQNYWGEQHRFPMSTFRGFR